MVPVPHHQSPGPSVIISPRDRGSFGERGSACVGYCAVSTPAKELVRKRQFTGQSAPFGTGGRGQSDRKRCSRHADSQVPPAGAALVAAGYRSSVSAIDGFQFRLSTGTIATVVTVGIPARL